jgi:hypothetical protein
MSSFQDLLHFLQQQENLFSEVADQMYFIVNQDLRDAKYVVISFSV